MKNILVTGATGYVGKKVIQELGNLNVNIFPICRPGQETLFKEFANIKRVISSLDLFQEDENWWEEQCKDIDIIIHVAWYMKPGHKQSPKNIDCLIGSLNLAKGAAKAGIKRFIGVGTYFEYDLSMGTLSINTPLKPSTHYGAAKAALYIFLSEWLPERSIEFSWCRLFSLYGEGGDERMLDAYIHKQLKNGEIAKLTDGKQVRDFLHVIEAGRIMAGIAIGNRVGPINVCSGIPITVEQFALQIARKYNRPDLLKFNARPANFVDPMYVLGVKNY